MSEEVVPEGAGGLKRYSIFLLVLALIVGFLGVFLTIRETRYSVSPEMVRPRATFSFDDAFQGGPVVKVKTLGDDPAPDVIIERESDSGEPQLSISWAVPENRESAEIPLYHADADGVCRIPNGPTVTLDAIALLRPWLLVPNEKGKIETELQWLDPMSGEPDRKPHKNPWVFNQHILKQGAELFLKFDYGEGVPVNAELPRAFNVKNRYQIASRSGYMEGDIFSLTLGAWNQHSIVLVIEITYGEPERKLVPAIVGESISFGKGAQVRMVAEVDRLSGRSTHRIQRDKGLATHTTLFHLQEPDPDRPSVLRFFQLWPPEEDSRFQYRWGEKGEFRDLNTNAGLFRLAKDSEAEFSKLEIQRMPQKARLVFEIPRLPHLPVVENQFETPIPAITLSRASDLKNLIRNSLEMTVTTSSQGRDIDSHFPMELKDTTPMGVIELFEELKGDYLYYDREEIELTDEKPPGVIEMAKDWWEKSKPKWWP